MSAFTQNFQLEFLAPGEPIRNTRAVLERMAKSVDAALTRGGIAPPEAQDLVAVAGRVSSLENRVRAFLYQATAQTGLATGWNTVSLDAEAIDTHSGHAAGPGYVIPVTGFYLVDGQVQSIRASSGLLATCRVQVNGADVPGGWGSQTTTQATADLGLVLGAKVLSLTAGQVLTLQGFINGSGWATQSAIAAGQTVKGQTSWLSVAQL